MHVALLGDSIFDNAAYTRGQPDVVSHLRALLPEGARATLVAVDGTTTGTLAAQLREVPADATSLMVAVGGNDALADLDMLDLPVRSTAQALELFGARLTRFERNYTSALEAVLALGRPVTVCTIYEGNLPEPDGARARVAVRLYDDVILRFAAVHGLDAIELRAVCMEAADYANPIEPSGVGGEKIARAILRALAGPGERSRTTRVYV